MSEVKPTGTMPNGKKCPQCGTTLPAGALDGLCPACLLKQGAAADTATGGQTAPFNPPPVSELAALFPQLEILEFVGKGGMGAVYKARQKQLDRIVALKILPPGIGDDPAFAGRFAREAKALARLNHPGIVTLYEFGVAAGVPPGGKAAVGSERVESSVAIPGGKMPPSTAGETPAATTPSPAIHQPSTLNSQSPLYYFLMEFVDGVNLRQLLQAGRISPREALAIVPQICDALQFAHDQGIVHRDIKPENILLDRRGRVKVADFGLAKIVGTDIPLTRSSTTLSPTGGEGRGEGDLSALTDAGKVMGTPRYMAPEQIERPAEVDHRADIYALGVVFYQMLTGELPGKHIEPPSRKVQIDVRLDEVVLRALEKKPELRYQQVSEVKTCVETIVGTPDPRSRGRESAPTESERSGESQRRLTSSATIMMSVVLTYAVAALGGVLIHLLGIGWGDQWTIALFVLSALVSPLLTFAVLRFGKADTQRVFLKTGGVLASVTALPVVGFAAFFVNALASENFRWNPAPTEAVLVPLTWLGALLLPVCGWRLLRAVDGSNAAPGSTRREEPRTDSSKPRHGCGARRVFWLVVTLLGLPVGMFAMSLAGWQLARRGITSAGSWIVIGALCLIGLLLAGIGVGLWRAFRKCDADTVNPWPRRLLLLILTLLVSPAIAVAAYLSLGLLSQKQVENAANSPRKLRSVATVQVIQAGLAEPKSPWAWQELERRARAGRLSTTEAGIVLNELSAWIRRDYPDGYGEPLHWIRDLLHELNRRRLVAEGPALEFLVGFYGSPSCEPLPRLRETNQMMGLTCKWRSPWHDNLLGMVLLNEMRTITIDGQPVAYRDSFGTNWHRTEFSADLQLPSLTPGKHIVRCEIESALVAESDMPGLAPDASSRDWPPAKRRWTRTAQAELSVYPTNAELVSLTQDPSLDPVANGKLSVRQVIVRPAGNRSQAIILFNIGDTLPVPISFDATLRLGGKSFKCGTVWSEKRVKGRAYMGSADELNADIELPGPQVQEAEIVLTPNPRPVETLATVDHIWGKEVVFRRIPLTRHDLAKTTAAPQASAPAFGPVIERVVDEPTTPNFNWFDLDTGKSVSSGNAFPGRKDDDVKDDEWRQWRTKVGVDVAASLGLDQRGLAGIDPGFISISLNEDQWNQMTPSALERMFQVSRWSNPAIMSGEGKLPATYAFKTREGGTGILQITGFSNKPRGLKIRYKLVQPAGSQSSLSLVIERLIRDAPDWVSVEFPPELAAEYARHRVKCFPLTESNKLSTGNAFHLLDRNTFFIQWDRRVSTNMYFYGPFKGDPVKVLGIALAEKTN